MTNDSFVLDISWTERALEGGILLVILTVALLGNISLWLVVLRSRDIRNHSSYLLLCLSFADIIVCVVGMPMTISSIFYGRWFFDKVTCSAIGFINMTTFIASVMSLGVISFNRYIKICHSTRYNNVYTTRNIVFMVGGVWFLSICLAFPPLVGWGSYAFIPTQSICFCDWPSSVSYTFFMVGTCFGGPCSAMTFCYYNILKIFRESSSRIAALSQTARVPSSVSSDNNNSSTLDASSQKPQVHYLIVPEDSRFKTKKKMAVAKSKKAVRKRQEEFRLTFSLLIVMFVFIICWLPFCITMFLSVFAPWTVRRGSNMFTIMLGYLNSVCNPIIYGFMNSRFKAAYRRLFLDICFWRKVKQPNSGGTITVIPSASEYPESSTCSH